MNKVILLKDHELIAGVVLVRNIDIIKVNLHPDYYSKPLDAIKETIYNSKNDKEAEKAYTVIVETLNEDGCNLKEIEPSIVESIDLTD